MKLVVQQNTADARCEWFLRAEDGSETGLLKRADAELIAREFDALRAQIILDSDWTVRVVGLLIEIAQRSDEALMKPGIANGFRVHARRLVDEWQGARKEKP